ncbi:M4 family metallopeptidase [Flammeovirga yaeyamensis]|uniref:M4 family metallopeptidase n=1 Tax=Flammeovirga yaeyamensis TaxID=367791 RepID=A0AAX1N5Y1_9BACT|nr:M4 family metallopeptidase [Flammeovirga yaeyamensis]MBB3698160.1 Zn-dependent metalloprotease [Flammeovirga yaeyamensis]NMF34483.1 T9SS type A sorting domain-containing protein [Flammeovirga yaeyamensis]QWG01462.1 M4 family metallopeptidase [Flammeovirga yaeyamensis]
MKKQLMMLILIGITMMNSYAQEFINFEDNSNQRKNISLQQTESVLRQQLQLTPPVVFKQIDTKVDDLGISHRRFQEYYQNVKVEYGGYTLNFKGTTPLSIVHYVKQIDIPSVEASISEEEALSLAVKHVGASKYMWQLANQEEMASKMSNGKQTTFYPNAELVIVPNYEATERELKMKPVLAYKFDIYAEQPLSRSFIYIDAITGKVVHINPIIKHAEANGTLATRYSGSKSSKTDSYNGSYRLRDYTRGSGIETYDMNTGTNYNSAVDFVDSDNNWTSGEWNNAQKDNAAFDAHWGAQMTYDYFISEHNRDSWDGNGAKIKSYVHFDNAYDNAFWNGSVMTYGDGSDTYFDALTSLDVAAHEIGHAICETTANLVYQRESGALNEGFSDIWAACVEAFAAPEKDIWLIGEDIERRSTSQALRSMSDPNSENQPDTYGGSYWQNPNCGTPTRNNDYCGVHTNSGVLNHWFYILTVGKNGTNDIGSSYSVSAIGIEKSAKIAYRTEAVYLTSTSTFADARTFSIQSAIDLYGAGSNEVVQTTNAWYAVGVGSEFGTISYCSSAGSDASYEWIANVTVGDMINTTGTNGGYNDFSSSKSVTMSAGSTYNVSLSPGFSNTAYNEYWKIWIDYNGDGDFDDANELAFDAGGLSQTTQTGSITVPSTVGDVTTKMRVSMKYNGTQTVCETFSYGEVEDYEVIISNSGTPQVCDVPTGLSVSNITASTVDVSWNNVSAANDFTIRLRESGGTWSDYTATNPSASFTGLTENTSYDLQVASNCSSGSSAFSSIVSFTTLSSGGGVPTSYCSSTGSNDFYFWIDNVNVGGLNNSSSKDGGYGDYTNLSAGTITRGASETITFSAGYNNTLYTVYWSIWIDYNRDGDFEDANELFVQGSSSSAGTLTSTQTIPATASLGTTRMRVSMKYGSVSTPCETFTYGEVEDYLVNITSSPSINAPLVSYGRELISAMPLDNDILSRDFSIYPNPSSTLINIDAKTFVGNGVMNIYSINGQNILSIPVDQSKTVVPIDQLKKGLYLIKINNELESQTKKFIVE